MWRQGDHSHIQQALESLLRVTLGTGHWGWVGCAEHKADTGPAAWSFLSRGAPDLWGPVWKFRKEWPQGSGRSSLVTGRRPSVMMGPAQGGRRGR